MSKLDDLCHIMNRCLEEADVVLANSEPIRNYSEESIVAVAIALFHGELDG